MSNEQLQKRFNELKEEANRIRLENARLDANIETKIKEKEELEEEIFKITGTKSLAEANEKFELLKQKAKEIIEKAEKLLKE